MGALLPIHPVLVAAEREEGEAQVNRPRSRKAWWLMTLLGLLLVPSGAALATDGVLSGSGTAFQPNGIDPSVGWVGQWSLQVWQSGASISGTFTEQRTWSTDSSQWINYALHITGGDIAGLMYGTSAYADSTGASFTTDGDEMRYIPTGSPWGLGYFVTDFTGIFYIQSGMVTLSPLYRINTLYDPTKAVKSGATIPIKLQVLNGSGANISSSSLVVHATGVVLISGSAPGTLVDDGNANPDSDFRYDATLGGYIFNLKTTGLSGTYALQFTVAGSGSYTVQFEVK